MNFAALEDRKTLSDHRHIALIEVTKRTRFGPAGNASLNQLAGIPTLLHRNLRHAGQGPAPGCSVVWAQPTPATGRRA